MFNATFNRFETRGGSVVAIFRHDKLPMIEPDGSEITHTESTFTRSGLEARMRNLEAAGFDAMEENKALKNWPSR
jgi:hypothetical protein